MDQLLITALLVTIISICVFLVIGLLLWYCYRRCTRSSQDPHRPPTRRAYEYIFQSFRSQDRQWPRLLPPPARELRYVYTITKFKLWLNFIILQFFLQLHDV